MNQRTTRCPIQKNSSGVGKHPLGRDLDRDRVGPYTLTLGMDRQPVLGAETREGSTSVFLHLVVVGFPVVVVGPRQPFLAE